MIIMSISKSEGLYEYLKVRGTHLKVRGTLSQSQISKLEGISKSEGLYLKVSAEGLYEYLKVRGTLSQS